MVSIFQRVLREWQGLKAFKSIPRAQRRIVFYSEGGGYWTYFEPVFRALQQEYGEPVLYVTSSELDPLLHSPPPGLRPFNVGEGSVRTIFFSGLEADVLLMTMPDLQTFHIKRSPYPVKYVYLHHSLVSTHMVYRPQAFDHFDTILCAGPHHVTETRAREAWAGQPAKELVPHGYGRLDAILANGASGPKQRAVTEQPHVLVAPTWGATGLLELHAEELVSHLLASGLNVTVRPHPRTRQLQPEILHAISARFGDNPQFALDEDTNALQSLHAADLMISDWSGAALDFALGLERPVIFVDVPRKIQNPAYTELGHEPLEVRIREQLGKVLATDNLGMIGTLVAEMVNDAARWQEATREARTQWVFNPGKSGHAAATYLRSLIS